jgi:hypothetical protein
VLGFTDGAELASFNLYPGERDAWVAPIHEDNGQTLISTPDMSCIFPTPHGTFLTTIPDSIELRDTTRYCHHIVEQLAELFCPATFPFWGICEPALFRNPRLQFDLHNQPPL